MFVRREDQWSISEVVMDRGSSETRQRGAVWRHHWLTARQLIPRSVCLCYFVYDTTDYSIQVNTTFKSRPCEIFLDVTYFNGNLKRFRDFNYVMFDTVMYSSQPTLVSLFYGQRSWLADWGIQTRQFTRTKSADCHPLHPSSLCYCLFTFCLHLLLVIITTQSYLGSA